MTDTKELSLPSRVLIYWDDSDPENRGWAYKLEWPNGEVESGADYDLPVLCNATDMQTAVQDLAYRNGRYVDLDDIMADPDLDGGFAEWSSKC